MGSPHAQRLSAATRLIGDPVTIGEVFEFSMAGSTTSLVPESEPAVNRIRAVVTLALDFWTVVLAPRSPRVPGSP